MPEKALFSMYCICTYIHTGPDCMLKEATNFKRVPKLTIKVHMYIIVTWFTRCSMTPGEGALSDATEQGPGREQQSLYLSFPVSGRLTGEVGGSGCGYGV